MAERYWTHCMYCGEMICGVDILEDYPDVVVLYAHRDCYERHTHGRAITPASGGQDTQDLHTGVSDNAGAGRTDAEL